MNRKNLKEKLLSLIHLILKGRKEKDLYEKTLARMNESIRKGQLPDVY
ncbi:hypothetical protein HY945_05420 [Candidatus Gottesmanbacteria bacterium]|nr:hypothetical protein [Candidatus Gottesmanbacteria bacterium]